MPFFSQLDHYFDHPVHLTAPARITGPCEDYHLGNEVAFLKYA